ncbi:MAG: FAD-dependent oxidoreductase [Crocinitomicaceae bacterium]|nr:FAD-dependent oxidoreductase [Crocinitomicaceae bacterium]
MKIAIIGGGITGLTTAIALAQKGLSATVYEKAPELNEIGAGVWMQPNAMRVFQLLGIDHLFPSKGKTLNRMDITDDQLRSFRKVQNETVTDEFGNQTIAIHRGKLQQLLYDEASKNTTVHLGHGFQSYQKENTGYRIHFENGTSTYADLILACDGIHSAVRFQLFPNTNLRDSGQICWRGIASYPLPDEFKNYGRESWGKGIRFGFSEISDNQVYWFAVAKATPETEKISLKELPNLFGDFHPVVLELIKHTDNSHIGPLKDLERLPRWFEEGICLLGDAAHATTPNMGQGACQGIEDAYYLAHFLKNNPENAFELFENSRRKKVDFVVKNSWRFGKAAHSSSGQKAMKLVFKYTPESMLNKQMKELYSLKGIE